MLNKLYEYIDDVNNGNILVGKEIKQAVARFEKDLLREDIYFSDVKAERAIKFIQGLQHFTGKFNGKHFILEPWQVFIIANIFGWIRKDSGLRKYTDAYIEIAKKNGKTAFAAAISLYCLILDGEANAEIILAANSREQAKLCFDAVSKFSKNLDPKERHLVVYRNEVKFSNNRVKIVASDASKLDGLNCSCVILDEYHAAKTSDVYSNLKSSQGMREQPLFIVITTAGYSKKGPCYSLRTTAKEVLSGLKEDDNSFIAIYSLDENDNYTDPKNWIKANPNLNVTVKPSFLSNEILKAQNNISVEVDVKTKNLNIWCDTITTWISDTNILNCSKNLSLDDVDEETEIIVGIDLSSNTDITAISYMWYKDDIFYFKNEYYLPQDSLNTAQDKVYYNEQYRKGNLHLIPGQVIIYEDVIEDILKVAQNHNISIISYDPSNAARFLVGANTNGLRTSAYPQNLGSFNRPTKEFERLILSGKLFIDNNEITRWMLSNVFLKMDHNGNVKPDKSRVDKKIDGVIAMLEALGYWLVTPRYNIQVIV